MKSRDARKKTFRVGSRVRSPGWPRGDRGGHYRGPLGVGGRRLLTVRLDWGKR